MKLSGSMKELFEINKSYMWLSMDVIFIVCGTSERASELDNFMIKIICNN